MSDRLISKLRFWALADPVNEVLHDTDDDMPDFRACTGCTTDSPPTE